MGSIRQLSPTLVNKIAAGECIERPSSVVKELIENSLDAGAHRVQLEIEDGGKKLIRVVDDGKGISSDDLPLAVTAHATSKLADEQQLFAICTMGFRGEALASVGAVSQLTVTSATHDAETGYRIDVDGGTMGQVRAEPVRPGTIIEVRNLFFNVPARRKFLRTAPTEVGHINEQVVRLALPRWEVAFEVTNNDRQTMQLQACEDMAGRLGDVFGVEVVDGLIPVDRQEKGLRIRAFVSRPEHTRGSNRWQYTFLNGRWIRDKYITHAVKEAYRGLIDPQRYPLVFMFLDIDPEQVDVNVHPTKAEVRFADSQFVHSQVLAVLRETFSQHDLTAGLRPGRSAAGRRADASPSDDEQVPAQTERIRQAMAEYFERSQPQQSTFTFRRSATGSGGAGHRSDEGYRRFDGDDRLPADSHADNGVNQARQVDSQRDWSQFGMADAGIARADDQSVSAEAASERVTVDDDSPLRAIQIHNSYLVAQTSEGVVIIDQHALHERVIYEQLRARVTKGPLERQRLLMPEVVDVTDEQMAHLGEVREVLEQLGVTVSEFGPRSVAIQSFPTLLERVNAASFLRDVLDGVDEFGGPADSEQMLQHVLDTMACKAAVKAGQSLKDEEIQALMEYRHLVERSSACPHGRPTTLRLSLEDLSKQFKRT